MPFAAVTIEKKYVRQLLIKVCDFSLLSLQLSAYILFAARAILSKINVLYKSTNSLNMTSAKHKRKINKKHFFVCIIFK